MPRLTPEQLASRRSTIGSSDIASLAKVNPFGGPLDVWIAKEGLRDEFGGEEENEQAENGHDMEPIFAARYAARFGYELQEVGTLVHPQYPWATASPDRLVVGAKHHLEIKNVGFRVMHHWPVVPREDRVGVPKNHLVRSVQPPPYVVVQALWQAFVLRALGHDIQEIHVAAQLGGRDFYVFAVPYDEETAQFLFEIAKAFHEKHMLAHIPPQPDGSDIAGQWLQRQYGTEGLLPMAEAPEAMDQVLAALAVLRELESAVEKRRKTVENLIKAVIGHREGIKGKWGSVAWKPRAGKVTVDWEAVARDLYDLFARPHTVPLADYVAMRTTTAEASRWFGPPRFSANVGLAAKAAAATFLSPVPAPQELPPGITIDIPNATDEGASK